MASSREIDRIASEWLAQRDAGRWTPEDETHFQSWLNASPLHRVEFLRIEAAWLETRRMKALAAGIESERPPPPGQWNVSPFFEPQAKSTPKERNPKRRGWLIAASVLPLLITGISWKVWPSGQQYSTPVGGTSSVPMSDGSQVTLNTNSHIRVALSASERDIDLEQGEAFFEVAKDPKRPFVVKAGGKRVIAVGTQFSVRREAEGIEVIVTEGKVRVEDASGPLLIRGVESSGSAMPEDPKGAVFLTAGSIARTGKSGVLVQRKTVPQTEENLSWRRGVLTFREETLGDAIAEFNRYSERPVVIDDPAVAALKIEGNFSATNVAAFLELLQGGYPVKVVEEANRYVVTAK